MRICVIAELSDSGLASATLHTVSAASALQAPIDVLLLGDALDQAAKDASRVPHVHTVYLGQDPLLAHALAEPFALAIMQHLATVSYTHVLIPATTFGKNILPRVAGMMKLNMISDVIGIPQSDTFLRPIYAGNAIMEVKNLEPLHLVSIRTTAFPSVEYLPVAGAEIKTLRLPELTTKTHFVSEKRVTSTRPELTSARIVVSGGRGLKSLDNFALLTALADQLGAAIGASRAAVDAGFAPNDWQVGQTGKVVAPDLYIAVGISGAIQHVAGMKDSKVIVAINQDPDAPIFEIADYGLVQDLFTALPALQRELQKG